MPARERRVSGTTEIRALPEVVGARGTLSDAPLVDESQADAVVVGVAPPREAEDGLQPRAGTVDATVRYGVDLAELAERAGGRASAARPARSCAWTCRGRTSGRRPGCRGRACRPVSCCSASAPGPRRTCAAPVPRWPGRPAASKRVLSAVTADAGAAEVRAYVEGYLLAAYAQPRRGEAPAGTETAAAQLVLLTPPDRPDVAAPIEAATRAAAATWLVRDLANTPSDVKDPAWFADRALGLADELGLDTTLRGPAELATEGFGALLAVGAGSARGPRLLTVTYDPADHGVAPAKGRSAPRHVVVVGKGITYDTGGLSIKPREAMVPMKTDMAGAAVALAVVLRAARARSDGA